MASRSSLRASMRTSQLTQQLGEVQGVYKALQEATANSHSADGTQNSLQLMVHPGLQSKIVPATAEKPKESKGASAADIYDHKRRELSALILEMIMTLRMEQISSLRRSFEAHGGEVSVAQFVAIMASHLDVARLKTTPDMLIRSLVELFDSMDLDGDQSLAFEELLTTVVHMGLAATEHLLLTPISPYREGPQYLVSMQQIDRAVTFIPERDAVLVADVGDFAFRLFDPAMRHALAVELPISSALSMAYVTGVRIDTQQNNGSYKRNAVAKPSYYTSGKPSASEERKKAAAALAALQINSDVKMKEHDPMWTKLTSMPLSRPMRWENGQPMLSSLKANANATEEDDELEQAEGGSPISRKKNKSSSSTSASSSSFGSASSGTQQNKKKDGKPGSNPVSQSTQLFSEFAAKPYYGSGQSLHSFTNNTSSSAAPNLVNGVPTLAGSRTPLVFIHEDFLITSTSQYLQIWDGFPTGPATLCDRKRIRSSYSCMKWCQALQRLFCGDMNGNIDIWKIQILPPAANSSVQNKPTLIKERELAGHTDIITGLESISSMGFLLSSSLDASIRMFDVSNGQEKNRFIGHRAGVVGIAYSNEYRFLLSAGSDHQVCVWSPFAEKQVYTLRGHNAPLIGVQFVPGTPQIVTADSDGWMKIWDARNFACCQTFFTIPQLTAFTACSQRHKRIFVVGKCHEMRIYEQEGGPFLKRKAEEPIFTALYSPFTMTMLTASREDVKIWDGLNGNLSRVYRGLAESDLSAVCLDARQRKLFVADQHGKIRCYNFVTGAYMKSLTPHKEEVIALAYSGTHRALISATDRTVYVHDERPIEEQVLHLTAHPQEGVEFLVIAVSEKLSSLACAMSNGKIDLWNLDQSMRDSACAGSHPDVITAMLYIDSHQLLLSADDSGTIKAWFVRPNRWKGQLAFELHTPAARKDGMPGPQSPNAAPQNAPSFSPPSHAVSGSIVHTFQLGSPREADPILHEKGLANIPGICSMQFHAATSTLFCGHRNGHIQMWNLTTILDFLAKVINDPSATWFVTDKTPILPPLSPTSTSQSIAVATSPPVVTSPVLQPQNITPTAADFSNRGTMILNPRRSSGGMLASILAGSRAATRPGSAAVTHSNLPIKDQLAAIASATRPSHYFIAHESPVMTLHIVLDPPSILSTAAGEHTAYVWSLSGDPLGSLDSVQGLARGYAQGSGVKARPSSTNSWDFSVNVAIREAKDRATTHNVLKELASIGEQNALHSAQSSMRSMRSSRPESAVSGGSSSVEAFSPKSVTSPKLDSVNNRSTATIKSPASAGGSSRSSRQEEKEGNNSSNNVGMKLPLSPLGSKRSTMGASSSSLNSSAKKAIISPKEAPTTEDDDEQF